MIIKAIKYALASGILAAVASTAMAAIDPIPRAVGNRWQYDCVKIVRGSMQFQGKVVAQMDDASSGSAVYEVLSVDNGSAVPVWDYRESTSTRSADTGREGTETANMRLVSDDAGLKIVSVENTNSYGGQPDKQTYEPPLFYFGKDALSGKPWDVGNMRDNDTTVPVTAKFAGRETVTVPAGTFKDCAKVIYSSDNLSGKVNMLGREFTIQTGKTRGIYWIADGVGVVKELEIATSTARAPAPNGAFVTMEGASCTVNELRPGYVVK